MPESFDRYPSLKQLPNETPAAYQAFIDYIDMGWERSLDMLIVRYKDDLKAGQKVPSKQRTTLSNWSITYEWQRRLGQWRQDVAAETMQRRDDYMAENEEWLLKMHRQLRAQIESMVARFDELKIAKKTRVPDPRNPGQEIEVVHQRVNVRDLEVLVKTYCELGEKLRRQLGLRETVNIEIPGVKAIIGFSPEEWDAQHPSKPDEPK